MLARLNACPKHYFSPQEKYEIGEPLTCVHCKGRMPLPMLGVYIRGFQAAGGDPTEICPDWS
jgi:hypothetical protein